MRPRRRRSIRPNWPARKEPVSNAESTVRKGDTRRSNLRWDRLERFSNSAPLAALEFSCFNILQVEAVAALISSPARGIATLVSNSIGGRCGIQRTVSEVLVRIACAFFNNASAMRMLA
jgi:hypothetical protein